MNKELMPFYQRLLNEKLIERIEKNSKYSIRAFAKALGMDSSALSQVLRGQRFFSEKKAKEVLGKLDFSPQDQEAFLTSLAQSRLSAGLKRMSKDQKQRVASASSKNQDQVSRDLSLDVFRVISNWYHYAIMELTRIPVFQNNPTWIAKRLGITVTEVTQAIDRLKSLDLLEEKNGTLKKIQSYIGTAHQSITAPALKKRQKQIIEKSLNSLENHDLSIRNHSARTFPVSLEKIPEAKKRIERFMLELGDFLGSDSPNHVYELSVQLFPLEENIKPKPSQLRRSKNV